MQAKLHGKMHYSKRYIMQLRQEAAKKNIWFSQEELDFFKEQRVIREKRAEKQKEKEEQERIQRERKEFERSIKEEEQRLKEFKRTRRKMLQPYLDQNIKLKRSARREVSDELNTAVIGSTKYRTQFFEVLLHLFQLEEIISDEDIEILKNTMYSHPQFIKSKNIKMMIINEGRKKGFQGAEKMVSTLMDVATKPEVLEALSDYRTWLRQQIRSSEIKKLQEQGFSKEQISRKLNITTAEVIVFGDKAKDSKDVFKKEDIQLLD